MAPAESEHEAARVARRRYLARFVWLAIYVVVAVFVGKGSFEVTGSTDGLLPIEHRRAHDEHLALLWLDQRANDRTSSLETEDLLVAADDLHRMLGESWIPTAPPTRHLNAWLDAHAPLLIPPERHPQLRARLTDEAIAATVTNLRSRLSSPFFNLTDDDPRHDPLRLRTLIDRAAGSSPFDMPEGVQVTDGGDLIADGGLAVLVAVRTRNPQSILDAMRKFLAHGLVRVSWVGTTRRKIDARQRVSSTAIQLFTLTLAGVALILAASLRRADTTLAAVLTIGAAVITYAASLPIDPLTLPLLILWIGYAGHCAGHAESTRRWQRFAIDASILWPLLLCPYPAWRPWPWYWAVGIIAVAVTQGLFRTPATNASGRAWVRIRPSRHPHVAAAIALALLSLGAWSWMHVPYAGMVPQLHVVEPNVDDAGDVVVAASRGANPMEALERSTDDARRLTDRLTDVARIDSPGSVVLDRETLERRTAALTDVNLAGRMKVLAERLRAEGFNHDAFSALVPRTGHTAGPTPEAALQSPLGPWIQSHIEREVDGFVLRTRVHLRGQPGVMERIDPTSIPPLFGPAIAQHHDRGTFSGRLGILLVCQFGLTMVLLFFDHRTVEVSVSIACAALLSQLGVVSVMVMSGSSLGPADLPALLLVSGPALTIARGSCEAVGLDRTMPTHRLAIASLCPAAAGMALIATGVPPWVQLGRIVFVGSVLAVFVGLFVSPGLVTTLRRLRQRPPSRTGGHPS